MLKQAADLRKQRLEVSSQPQLMSRRMFFSSPSNNNLSSVYTIYNQILEEDPSEIRAYNGKRKLMLQEGEDLLSTLKVYLNGVKSLSNHSLLKERLAKEYYRILSGNKKLQKQLPTPYNDSVQLSHLIKTYLESAKTLEEGNLQISLQLEKIEELISIDFFTTDSRLNKDVKLRAKNIKAQRKQEIDLLRSDQLKRQLNVLKKRVVNTDRTKDTLIREKKYIKALQKEKKFKDSVEQAVQYYNRNPKDIDGLKLVRVILKKNKRFDLLENIERQNQNHQNSFWAKLSLIDVMLKQIEVNNNKNYSEVTGLLNKVKSSTRFNREKYEITMREMRLSILSNQDAEKKLISLGEELVGIRQTYKIDRFARECVYYFQHTKARDNSIKVLNLVLKSSTLEEDNDNQLLKLVALLSEFRLPNKEHDEGIQKQRDKLLNS